MSNTQFTPYQRLELQRTRKMCLYEPKEDADIEAILPYFEKQDRKRKD